MSVGILMYHCRKCGKKYKVSIPDVDGVLVELVLNEIEGWYGDYPVRLVTVHPCSPGHFGVADLIGGRETEASATPPAEAEAED